MGILLGAKVVDVKDYGNGGATTKTPKWYCVHCDNYVTNGDGTGNKFAYVSSLSTGVSVYNFNDTTEQYPTKDIGITISSITEGSRNGFNFKILSGTSGRYSRQWTRIDNDPLDLY